MMKKIAILLTICILIFPTNILANEQRVFDYAELLSDDEMQKLEEQIAEIQDMYNIDVVLMTGYYSGEKPLQQFAVDFYNEHFFEDGMLLLIDMNERYIYQTYTGRMITHFTEDRKIDIEDVIFEYAGNENYNGMFNAYIREVKGYLDFDHRSSTQKVLDSSILTTALLLAVGISYFMMRSKTKKGRLYENRDKHKRELHQKLVYDIDQAELFDSKTTRVYTKSKKHKNSSDSFISNNYTGSTTNRSSSKKTTTSNSSKSANTTTHQSSSNKTHSGRGRNF